MNKNVFDKTSVEGISRSACTMPRREKEGREEIFFSIIVPLYNKADYIARALDSVFMQTFKNFELVIVDDESTDQSLYIVNQYFKAVGGIPRNVKIITARHAGVGSARNNGVANSTGYHLVFLDADDIYCLNYLESMKNLIDRWPKAKIWGTNYFIMKNGEKKIALEAPFKEGIIVYYEVYTRSLCMPLTANSYCITRDAFEEIGGYRTDLSLGEDFDLWLKVTLRHPLVFLNKPLSVYSQDADPKHRAMGRMHDPKGHVIFHLDEFKEDEKKIPLLKALLDRMRVATLDDYYFTEYQVATTKIINEVDWFNQSWYDRMIYHSNRCPIPLKRTLRIMKKILSKRKMKKRILLLLLFVVLLLGCVSCAALVSCYMASLESMPIWDALALPPATLALGLLVVGFPALGIYQIVINNK